MLAPLQRQTSTLEFVVCRTWAGFFRRGDHQAAGIRQIEFGGNRFVRLRIHNHNGAFARSRNEDRIPVCAIGGHVRAQRIAEFRIP